MIDNEEFQPEFDDQQPDTGTQLPPMAAYEVDQLNYLRDITEDHYYERILAFVDYSPFTEKTKNDLRLLIFTYTEPIDYALTNIKSDRELRRFYNGYRMARKRFKASIRQRDNTSTLAQLLDHIESHMQLRLSRAKSGFERREQQSVRQYQSQDGIYTQNQNSGEQRTDSISQIFRGKS